MIKFPRTQHITGSGIQSDDIKETVPLSFFEGKNIVIEEKVDGGCSGISSDINGDTVFPQSRGHILTGGDDHYWSDFKVYCSTYTPEFGFALGDEYVMFGEYMKAFHSVFYDQLPHYFLEFDIYCVLDDTWLSTPTRRTFLYDHVDEYLEGEPLFVHSVPVLARGICKDGMVRAENSLEIKPIMDYLDTSNYISDAAYDTLDKELTKRNVPGKDVILSLNEDRLMEGLYIKWEEDGIVKGRYKYVRPEFVNAIIEQGVHWKKRASIFNRLSE